MHKDPEHALAWMFLGLGALGIVGGAILIILAAVGFPTWHVGDAVEPDSLIAGALFAVMGVGFATFGAMIRIEGWEAAGD